MSLPSCGLRTASRAQDSVRSPDERSDIRGRKEPACRFPHAGYEREAGRKIQCVARMSAATSGEGKNPHVASLMRATNSKPSAGSARSPDERSDIREETTRVSLRSCALRNCLGSLAKTSCTVTSVPRPIDRQQTLAHIPME